MTQLNSILPVFLTPLAELVSKGGPVVAILLVLSLAAVALIFAKTLQFFALGVGRYEAAQKALAIWLAGDVQAARKKVSQSSIVMDTVVEKLFQHGDLQGNERALLKEDIERVCNQTLGKLRAYLRPLDMIAQTAPLIGLLGTVLGMIEAFQAMQVAGTAVDPAVLAGGIWVALLTTAVGLAVAIPVSAVVSWLDGRIEAEQAEMEALVAAFFTGAIADSDRDIERIAADNSAENSHAM